MVQGTQKISKKKEQKNAIKQKNTKVVHNSNINTTNSNDQTNNIITKKLKQHQKKIYKSIESTIIEKAKTNRERFDIL